MSSIVGMIVIKGNLHVISPLAIGSGMGEKADIEEVCKGVDGYPYIPSTSFVGKLKQEFYSSIDINEIDGKELELFWGTDLKFTRNDTLDNREENPETLLPSRFTVDDLQILKDSNKNIGHISLRDGIAIDSKKGITKPKAKFLYEVVNSGSVFNFYAEITLRDDCSKEYFIRIVKRLLSILENGELKLGRMTTKGFGKVKVNYTKTYSYNFKVKKDSIAWVTKDFSDDFLLNMGDFLAEFAPSKRKKFYIEAYFGIKSSLLVGSHPTESNLPDKVQLTMNKEKILPGTSITGVYRSRSLRILNTLLDSKDEGREIIKQLFGWVDDKKKDFAFKSRVNVEEVVLEGFSEEIQNRIKIDRFTGGTAKTALFNSMPLWTNKSNPEIKLTIYIDEYEDWHAGLLLLVLKDLWNEDLLLGGEKTIGRGILQGKRATIKAQLGSTTEWKAEIMNNGMPELVISEREKLEELVTSFNAFIQKKNSI